MKRTILMLLLPLAGTALLAGLLLGLTTPSAASPAPDEPSGLPPDFDTLSLIKSVVPPDAQSTTGPRPPRGVQVAGSANPSAGAVVIPDVPAYIWHHGCGPTAAGMVIGFWDGQGFDALVPGDAATQTQAVDTMIASGNELGPASPSNFWDYCWPIDSKSTGYLADKSEPPPGDEHPDDSVADYMKTSQSAFGNYYGWSYFSFVGPAMMSYVNAVAQPTYQAATTNLYMGSSLNWDSFRAEIDAGRPMVFLVDTNGDRDTDHFVTVVGYDVVNDVQRYGCLNTWDEIVHWWDFASRANGQLWGIYGATTFEIYDTAYYAPAKVSIEGPPTGTIGTDYIFTATVEPVSASLPITFVWQAIGSGPQVMTDGLTNTVVLSWNLPGPQVVTVTAMNTADTVSDTHVITIRAPLQADFTAWPTKGVAPLNVVFTNTSTGIVTETLWEFGDGLTDTLEHPTHTYSYAGSYSVTLSVSGPEGTSTVTHPQLIEVLPVVAAFEATPTNGPPPLTVTFTNTSRGGYTVTLWTFGDGVTSAIESPTHTYTTTGLYTVSLVVTNALGSDAETKVAYIDVRLRYNVYLPIVRR